MKTNYMVFFFCCFFRFATTISLQVPFSAEASKAEAQHEAGGLWQRWRWQWTSASTFDFPSDSLYTVPNVDGSVAAPQERQTVFWKWMMSLTTPRTWADLFLFRFADVPLPMFGDGVYVLIYLPSHTGPRPVHEQAWDPTVNEHLAAPSKSWYHDPVRGKQDLKGSKITPFPLVRGVSSLGLSAGQLPNTCPSLGIQASPEATKARTKAPEERRPRAWVL